MTRKELKKLNRAELLELLLMQTKRVDELQLRIRNLEEMLDQRKAAVSEVGSIAEVAMRLNGVFEAAQNAADQYLDDVIDMWNKTQKLCEKRKQEAEQMLETAKLKMQEKMYEE